MGQINALNPPVSVLIKFGQILNDVFTGKKIGDMVLFDDPEVIQWYDRMALLEYVPTRNVGPKADVQASLTVIPEGQPAIVSLLDAHPDRIDCGAVISESEPAKLEKSKGYQLLARIGDTVQASYAEARSVYDAFKRCSQEFPPGKYTDHAVVDIETNQQYIPVKPFKEILPLSLD